MASNGRRIAAWLSLASYLFAVTAANSFHDHGPQEQADHEPACHALSMHPHEGIDGRAIATGDGRGAAMARSGGLPAACSDGACPVCHFLLLKLLPMRPVESVRAEALRETPGAAQPLAAVRPPLLLQRSRAPPQVA